MSLADAESFISRVDDVTSQLQKMLSGEMSVEDVDRKEQLSQTINQIREREMNEKTQRDYEFGNFGKGTGENYLFWCRGCFTEFLYEPAGLNCKRCNSILVSKQQRKDELMKKVEEYKSNMARKQWRKDRYDKWFKTQQLLGKSGATDYGKWDHWEPEDDEDDEARNAEPILPKNDPNFAAMEKDLEERLAKRKEKHQRAEKRRMQGNSSFKSGDYVTAISEYDEGLTLERDNKFLWANKALAEIKIGRYTAAVDSCTRILEICELFEEGYKKSADIALKALLRRANALKFLGNFQGALIDSQEAVKLNPSDKEAGNLLEICKGLCESEFSTNKKQVNWKRGLEAGGEQYLKSIKKAISSSDDSLRLFCADSSGLKHFLANLDKLLLIRKKTERDETITEASEIYLQGISDSLFNIFLVVAESCEARASLVSEKTGILLSLLEFSEPGNSKLCLLLQQLSTYPSCVRSMVEVFFARHQLREIIYDQLSNTMVQEYLISLVSNILLVCTAEKKRIILQETSLANKISLILDSSSCGKVLKTLTSLICNIVTSGRESEKFCDTFAPKIFMKMKSTNAGNLFDRFLSCLHNCIVTCVRCRISFCSLVSFNELVRLVKERASKEVSNIYLEIFLKIVQSSDKEKNSLLTAESDAVELAKDAFCRVEYSLAEKLSAVKLLAFAIRDSDSSVLDTKTALSALLLINSLAPVKYISENISQIEKNESLLRGNLCLIIQSIAERQSLGGLLDIDLAICIPTVVAILRMDIETVQANAGVALTRIAGNERYKDKVRELNGFESLAQIQLRILQKKK